MSLDFLIVSLILLPAGGSRSMLFLVYFVVIISNGLRYGMRLSIFGVLIFNIAYVGVLLLEHYPEFRLKDFQNEILKVCGFWAVGLYVGYLSRRFDQLRGQTEKYQALLREALDEKKREARP